MVVGKSCIIIVKIGRVEDNAIAKTTVGKVQLLEVIEPKANQQQPSNRVREHWNKPHNYRLLPVVLLISLESHFNVLGKLKRALSALYPI
jgi:hypothetical protein